MPLDPPGTLVAPEPAPPVRQYSFTDWQVNNPTAPPPGDRLDAEFDRANGAITQTIDWVGTSLNTDGTLRAGMVGESQLVPGLFDHIADAAVAQMQPLVVEAENAAGAAMGSAAAASGSATAAGGSATRAAQSETNSQLYANASQTATSNAVAAMNAAAASATTAQNSANHADGSEAGAQAYADVSMAWAEHMPDTIPPNILAVMGVTGDHWSSRWWANRADTIIDDGIDQIVIEGDKILAEMQKLWLGAHPAPPSSDSLGNAITTGAVYYDTTTDTMYVWTGDHWKPVAEPSLAAVYTYIYVATQDQTLFTGPDRDGNVLKFTPAASQLLSVFRNGTLRTPVDDYVGNVDALAFLTPTDAGDIVQVWVQTLPVVNYSWTTVALDTSGWVFDGVNSTFPLIDRATGDGLLLSGDSDLVLSRDGVWQQAKTDYVLSGSGVQFLTPPPASARIFGVAVVVTPPKKAQTSGVMSLDTTGWVTDGTAKAFPLKDMGGNLVTPPNAENLLLSVNGVWQQAYTDYTVAGSVVTFAVAPETGAAMFGVAGLPAFLPA